MTPEEEMVAEAMAQSSGLLEDIIADLMENVYDVLDLKTMVVTLAVNK